MVSTLSLLWPCARAYGGKATKLQAVALDDCYTDEPGSIEISSLHSSVPPRKLSAWRPSWHAGAPSDASVAASRAGSAALAELAEAERCERVRPALPPDAVLEARVAADAPATILVALSALFWGPEM